MKIFAITIVLTVLVNAQFGSLFDDKEVYPSYLGPQVHVFYADFQLSIEKVPTTYSQMQEIIQNNVNLANRIYLIAYDDPAKLVSSKEARFSFAMTTDEDDLTKE